MGYTKYKEDIEEIINDRDYMKHYDEYGWRSKSLDNLEKHEIKKDLKEELEQVKQKINHIELWINYNNQLLNIFTYEVIVLQIKMQSKYLKEILDKYYNIFYDSHFNDIRNNEMISLHLKDDKFIAELNKDFINYIANKASILKSNGIEEAIILRKFYNDVTIFLKKMMEIDVENINVPIIKFIRDDLLKENNIKLIKCNRCKQETYEDFNVCIYCNNEVN